MKKILTVNLTILAFIFANNNQEDSIIPDLDIKLLNGKTATINQLLEDGPLLIDFWATWCKPCKKVMKHLDRYDTIYSDKGFKVLMINQDTPRSMGKVRSYIRSQKYQFLVGLDPNQKIAQKLNGMIMPTLILIDKNGQITWRHQGYMPGEEVEIERQIRLVLGLNDVIE